MYGACALALVEKRIFPSWALFTYKDLKESAEGIAPKLLAYIGDDVLILGPQRKGDKIYGMMISMESASKQLRLIRDPITEECLFVEIPEFAGKFYSSENQSVRVIIG